MEVTTLAENVDGQSSLISGINYAVAKLQTKLKYFLKAISGHQGTPATHVLVTLVSPSECNSKPYALPICCFPYVGLSESKARSHITSVVEEMCKQGMKVEVIVRLLSIIFEHPSLFLHHYNKIIHGFKQLYFFTIQVLN